MPEACSAARPPSSTVEPGGPLDWRNDAGFGGGPHCHVIETVAADGSVAYLEVHPSHVGHASSAGHGPFIADGNCDGMP